MYAKSKILFIICAFGIYLLIQSCAPNHLLGLKFLAEKHFVEFPDGRIKSFYFRKDYSYKENKTSLRLEAFNENDINKIYANIDSAIIQEITVKDLQTKFKDYKYILLSMYYLCPVTYKYSIEQYNQLIDTISKTSNYSDNVAFVFLSTSYDFKRIKYALELSDYHYQSYIIPSSEYGNIKTIKELNFIKELCPICYDKYKYYAITNTIFLIDNNGKVIKVIESQVNETNDGTSIKDFENVKRELIGLIKE